MKALINCYNILLFIFSIAVITGCSSTMITTNSHEPRPLQVVDSGYEQVSAKDANQSNVMVHPNEDKPSNLSLNDMLLRLPGVSVQGGGQYAKITVSGSASFMAGTGPLFVLNGNVVGTDYSTIYSIVNPRDVTSLSVLKGSDAVIYGTRGANGVILIRTK